MAQKLRLVLPGPLHEVLGEVGRAADRLGMGAFLVGGAVRDVLLSRGVEDVDIVVEGNGIDLARDLIGRLGGRMHPHEPFLTAVVQLDSGIRLDVATARTEFYRFPASLPEVERSAVRQDLYRRDFTINAMAIDLSPRRFGDLLDFFGGQRDLERKLVRVLHSLSFLDDPTRAIRAVRFATRLGFEIAAETQQLVRVAVREGVFSNLSGERIRDELAELLAEARPTESLTELDRLDVLREVAPGVVLNPPARRFLAEVEAMLVWSELEEVYRGPRWPVFIAALAVRAGEPGGESMARRLALSGRWRRAVATARVGVERILAAVSRTSTRPSEVVRLLERSDPALWVVGMAAANQAQRRRLRKALTLWLHVAAPVSGAQLIAAGVPPGPRVGEAVRASRDALLDGEVGHQEALAYALAAANKRGARG
jgi:tRNA nucleotidyltransferase (CCA-adding enzyme)